MAEALTPITAGTPLLIDLLWCLLARDSPRTTQRTATAPKLVGINDKHIPNRTSLLSHQNPAPRTATTLRTSKATRATQSVNVCSRYHDHKRSQTRAPEPTEDQLSAPARQGVEGRLPRAGQRWRPPPSRRQAHPQTVATRSAHPQPLQPTATTPGPPATTAGHSNSTAHNGNKADKPGSGQHGNSRRREMRRRERPRGAERPPTFTGSMRHAAGSGPVSPPSSDQGVPQVALATWGTP
jgi:hypothetical protein